MKPSNARKGTAAGRYRRAAKRRRLKRTNNETTMRKQMTLFDNSHWEQQLQATALETSGNNPIGNDKQIYGADISH